MNQAEISGQKSAKIQDTTTITIDSPSNLQKNAEKQQELGEFQDSLMKLKNIAGGSNVNTRRVNEDAGLLGEQNTDKVKTAQKQIDISKQQQNEKYKQELMIKSHIKESKENVKNVGKINGYFQKLKGIRFIDKIRVKPHQKMDQEEIHRKFQKAIMIVKTIVRLNKISENIRNYGTSSDLFNVAIRDRPTVKKVLFPLSTLNEEQEEQELAENLPFPLIHPENKINKIWNPIYLILMLYTATVMPYRIAFEDTISEGWQIADYFTDSLFWIDMIINMFTAFYNEDGQLVKTRKEVVGNYLKTWFVIDFLACFPFEQVLQQSIGTSEQTQSIKLVKLTRLPRMYRLVRITKVVKLFKFFDRNSFLDFLQFNTGILRLISLFMTVILIVHLMGCFWFYLAKLSDFDDETWVARNEMQEESQYSLYIASIYYSFTALTTVGYGDITARTNIEMIVTMFWMVFGVGFYSFTIGILSSVLAHMDTKSTNLQKKISIMNEFCNEMKISKDLKQKLRKALTFNSDKNCFSWADQQNIFRQLPINLRYEICMNIHQGVMKSFNFFTMEDDKYFVTRIVPILKPLHMEEHETLWLEGWNPESIYLLAQGRVNFMSSINHNNDKVQENKEPNKPLNSRTVKFKSMINGSYFGEIDIIKNRKRVFSAVCEVECELYYLPRFDYENIVKRDFPHIDEKLRQIAEERDKKNEQAQDAIKRIIKDPNKQTEDQISEQIRIEKKQQDILEKMGAKQNKPKFNNIFQKIKATQGTENQNSNNTTSINHVSRNSLQSKDIIEEKDEDKLDNSVSPYNNSYKVNQPKISLPKQNQNLNPLNPNKQNNPTMSSRTNTSDSSEDESSSFDSDSDSHTSSSGSDDESDNDNEKEVTAAKKEIIQVKEELLKYQKKASIIESKFSLLEQSLENTLQQLQEINGQQIQFNRSSINSQTELQNNINNNNVKNE